MNHNPYISFPDKLEITYSDIKTDENGEYVTLYFEQPTSIGDGFMSAECRIPGGELENIKGFDADGLQRLNHLISLYGQAAFDFAKEEYDICHN